MGNRIKEIAYTILHQELVTTWNFVAVNGNLEEKGYNLPITCASRWLPSIMSMVFDTLAQNEVAI